MIVYLHGFNSAGSVDNDKVIELQKIEDVHIITYDTFAPAAEILADIIEDVEDIEDPVFIGTSLGAFFAAQLAKVYDAPSVLINPAFKPEINLKEAVGVPQTNYVTGETYTLTQEALDSYKTMPDISSEYEIDPLVIVAEDDELIPAHLMREFFYLIGVHSTTDGGHRYNKPNQIIGVIEAYINHTAFATDINS
jgi:predicted esterase YcpF (UPF0227 family)